MGNYCCPPNEEGQKIKSDKKVGESVAAPIDFEYDLEGIQILIKMGDIIKESADAVVSGTDNFMQNRANSFLSPSQIESLNKEIQAKRGAQSSEPLSNGQVILTGPGSLKNVQHVFHLAIPIWRGGKHKELETLQRGFTNILNEATKNNIKSIIFTDIAASLFGIPKQHTAQTLIQAIRDYARTCKSPDKINSIKFIHKDKSTLLIFEDELKQEIGIKQDRNQSEYIDPLQESKVFSPDNVEMCVNIDLNNPQTEEIQTHKVK